MAEEQPLRALTEKAYQRLMKVLWWAESAMREQGIDFGDVTGEWDHEHVPPANYVRVTGSPATGSDTTNGIYPGQFVSLDGADGTGPWADYDPVQFCYVRDLAGAPLILSSSATAGPIYKGNVYANHGTGALVLVGGGGCTGGTSPTDATCDTSCSHTLIYDTCNGAVVTHSTLTMNFGVPVKFCLSQSTGPAPPCPTGPTGPSGIKREFRALPTVVGDSTLLGKTTLGSAIDVKVNGGTGFQMSKFYNVSHVFNNAATGSWYQVRPITAPSPYGAGNDFELDVRYNGSEQEYRVRRTVGTSAATATVDFFTGEGSFTASVGTGATGTTGYAPNMVITQIGDKVAVGKLSTDPPTFLLDLGSAGTGTTLDGISFNCNSSNVGTRVMRWTRSTSSRYALDYSGTDDLLRVTDGASAIYSWWNRANGTFNTTAAVIDSQSGANPAVLNQAANVSGSALLTVRPLSGNTVGILEVMPLGTQNETHFSLVNAADRGNAGSLRFRLDGNIANVDATVVGTGTLPTLLAFNIQTAYLADATFSSPVTFTSTGTASFAGGITSTASASFQAPVVFTSSGTATFNGGITSTASATFNAPVLFGSNGTATFASRAALNNGFTTAGSATFGAPAEFTSGGTATFTGRAVFNHSIQLESPGGANPLLMTQVGPTSGFSILKLQPSAGNAIGGYWIAPSGTETSCLVRYFNTSDTANAGYFQMTIGSVVTYSALENGTGTAPTRIDFTFPVTFTSTGTATFSGGITSTASASFQAPVAFTSTGTATHSSRLFATRSIQLESSGGGSPLLLSQVSPIGALCILQLQPTTSNSQPTVQVIPSGTVTDSSIRLANTGDPNIAGFLAISAGATTATIAGTTTGTGTAPTQLDISLPTKFTTTIGFQNTNPISKPTVTGSRGGNAALASLLTALANYGLITDSTSA